MEVLETIQEIELKLDRDRRSGLKIGFVPTMGFLHEGHMALVREAVANDDKVVLSIFVNPLQFGPTEDLDAYPRDMERDTKTAEDLGVTYLFTPSEFEIYPQPQLTTVDVAELTTGLCGANRPGHFRGVTTVLAKFLNIIRPDRLYLGKKDAQQLLTVTRMVADLNYNTEVVAVETVREPDGLAKSSRNALLTEEARLAVSAIPRSLRIAEESIDSGERDAESIMKTVRAVLSESPILETEYVSIVDRLALKEIKRIEGAVMIAVAVRAGGVRLIDNLWIDVDE